MKRLLITVFILMGYFSAFAQGQGITYQAVILNPEGKSLPGFDNPSMPMSDRDICLKFSFIDDLGENEYEEVIATTTDVFGMVNVVIGTGERIGGRAQTFGQILWDSKSKSLEVSLDKDGLCAQFVQISLQQFTSVPFALFALNSGDTASEALVGKSAYEVWLDLGNTGTVAEFINSLKGPQGSRGEQGAQGSQGIQGIDGINGIDGAVGPQGAKGVQGDAGSQGPIGEQGQGGITQSGDANNITLSGIGTTADPYLVNISQEKLNEISANTAKVGVTNGTAAGQMQYWDGTAWVNVSAGTDGQNLTFYKGVPVWIGNTQQSYSNTVLNPTTSKIWMDRNLGARQVATSSTDAASYGDLYQWGRRADGHQLRNSATTTTLSSID